MKKYSVIIQPPAIDDLDGAYQWIHDQSPQNSTKWFNGLVDAIQSREFNPQRRGLAAENDAVEPEIRQLLYGKRWNVYRALFSIRGNEVQVLHIRHAARRAMSREELQDDSFACGSLRLAFRGWLVRDDRVSIVLEQ